MTSVEDQVRAYALYADQQMEAVDIDQVGVSGDPVPASGRRGWVAFAISAAVVAVVVGAVPFVMRGAQPEPATQPIPTTATSPTLIETTVANTPLTTAVQDTPTTVANAPLTTAVQDTPTTVPPAAALEGWVQSVWTGAGPTWVTAYPSGGFVAGSLGLPASFSIDGVNWTDEPFHPELKGYRDLYIEGRFALANSIPSDHRDLDALWVPRQKWSGGHSWETLLEFEDGMWTVWDVGVPVMDPPVEFGDVTLINMRNPHGTVRDDYLTTSDGQTFDQHRLPPFEPVLSRPEFFAFSGGILGNQDGVIFYLTTDGINWQQIDLPDLAPSHSGGPDTVHFYDLGDRIVAQPWQDNLLWESTDGLQWKAANEPEAPWPDDRRVLHETSSGFVLTVTEFDLPGYEIWTSPDGTDWTSVDGPPTTLTSSDAPIFSVAGESIFLLLPNRGQAAMWVRRLPIDQDES